MQALLAIVADTWRQSRQQVVFMIMLGLMALVVAVAIGLTHTVEVERGDGSRVEVATIYGLDDEPEALVDGWSALYSAAILREAMTDDGESVDPFSEEGQAVQQKLIDAAAHEASLAPKRRAVEVVIYGVASLIYMVGMLLFIAACAGYFPALLEAGAVDIVLAKPLERWKIFLGKYLGGLALFAAALVGAYGLLFVGLGVRTGVWHPAIFRVMPLQLLSAASLFSLIALLGILRRSTALPMIIGYVFYFVVDRIVQVLMIIPLGERWRSVQKVLRAVVPNFVEVKETALMSIINPPALDYQPILVMFAWTGIVLGLGYWAFARRDY